MRAMRSVLVVVCAAVVLGGCQLIGGIKDEEGAPVPPDAGCGGRRPPDPLVEAGTGDNSLISTFALRSIQLDGVIGYNLDCHETSADGGGQPCPGSPEDDDGGVDSEINLLLASYLVGVDPVGTHFTQEMAAGSESMLLQIANAQPPFEANVNGLKVALISTNGLQYVNCNNDQVDGSVPPNWDGCDSWRQNTDFQGNFTNNAYIRDNQLVASYPATGPVLTISCRA